MKRHQLPSTLFLDNRKNFIKSMKKGSVAIFVTNDEMPQNADASLPFYPGSDIFYLTGIDQEQTRLILFPNDPTGQKTMLFIRETSEFIAIWDGYKYTKEHASRVSGIPVEQIFWTSQFDFQLHKTMIQTQDVYLNTNDHERSNIENEYAELRFARKLKYDYPVHNFIRASQILIGLRSIKHKEEIKAIKEACRITGDAYWRVLKTIKPNMTEYEVEAEIIHEFIKQKAQGHAYNPIIASGANACVLHYTDNTEVCKDGDLLLMDFGCRKNWYASDLTRTIPVNGKFTKRQKDVYNAVLNAFYYAKKIMKPGAMLNEMRKEVGLYIQDELIKLKLLTKEDVKKDKEAFKKYFMHGVSHHLGIDVHDFGTWHSPIQAGMVFTIEPGIYIPQENIGIRIETDVVVNSKGLPTDLMEGLPLTVEEIEHAMQHKK